MIDMFMQIQAELASAHAMLRMSGYLVKVQNAAFPILI